MEAAVRECSAECLPESIYISVCRRSTPVLKRVAGVDVHTLTLQYRHCLDTRTHTHTAHQTLLLLGLTRSILQVHPSTPRLKRTHHQDQEDIYPPTRRGKPQGSQLTQPFSSVVVVVRYRSDADSDFQALHGVGYHCIQNRELCICESCIWQRWGGKGSQQWAPSFYSDSCASGQICTCLPVDRTLRGMVL